jgi:hypothetical protein
MKKILLVIVITFLLLRVQAQVYNGDLLFSNQTDIDNFSFTNYTSINGQLTVNDALDGQHDITNLAGLAALTAVSGNVVLMNNNLLPNTVYLNLTSVGSLRISGNPVLTTINGLPITNAPSSLQIELNNALTSITAFSSVTTLGKLIVRDNPLLSNINSLANLTKVTDSLQIAYSNLTQLNVFSHLTEAGSLVIQNNPLLANINGLTALVKVRELDISYNAVLTNVNGLTNLASASLIIIYQNPALLNIAGIDNVIISNFGSLYIHNNNALQNVVGSAGCVRLGILSIQQNATLTGISGFNALKNVSYLDIAENQALVTVSGFAQLDSVSGTIRFQQNGSLTTINAFSNLRHIRVNYTNINNYVLSNIAPMPLLDSISGSFLLFSDTMLTNMDFVPNLRSVGTDILIRSCKRLANINGLSHLISIREGSVIIDSCRQLTNLNGLAGLTRIASTLSLRHLGVTGLNGLHNITKVGFSVRITNNLQLISLNGLISLDTVSSTIVITSNPLITDLNGLRNMRRTQGITVGDNAALAQFCGLYQLLSGNNPPNVVIGLNLVNPTAQEIVNAGPCTSVQLPVTLKSFGVRCYGGKVMANWVTMNEFNSSHFVLQRSIDGVAWVDLGSIQAAGNSGVEQTYNYIDDLPLLNGVYRLAQYDFDGRFHYSPVVKGGCTVQDEFTVWPNPTPDNVIVSIQSSIASIGIVRIFDSKGVVVRSGRVRLIRGLNRFELGIVDLAGGIYIVQIQNANGVSRNATVVKR